MTKVTFLKLIVIAIGGYLSNTTTSGDSHLHVNDDGVIGNGQHNVLSLQPINEVNNYNQIVSISKYYSAKLLR